MNIRKAEKEDLSRIAEIFVFNNRINYYPIFQDESYSFGELQVVSLADTYFGTDDVMKNLYVYEDHSLIKGFMQIEGVEVCKFYVDPFFQNQEIGHKLMEYAIKMFHVKHLWVLKKNVRAISFYQRYGFYLTGEKKFEEDTTEYLLRMSR